MERKKKHKKGEKIKKNMKEGRRNWNTRDRNNDKRQGKVKENAETKKTRSICSPYNINGLHAVFYLSLQWSTSTTSVSSPVAEKKQHIDIN